MYCINNNNLKNSLFLFDIDGTILDSRGSGKCAFIYALSETLEIEWNNEINFLGAIDYLIFKNIYKQLQLPVDCYANKWQEFQKIYLKKLYELSQVEEWLLYPETEKVILYLNKYSNIGLVTGNIKEGARIKLEKFGLARYFAIGGFGDYREDRKELVKDAITEFQKNNAIQLVNNAIYLFGDTEKDVKSAHDNGIIPILVDHQQRFSEKNNLNCLYFRDFTGIRKIFNLI